MFWERGISLPAAQLDVIAMEKILRRGVGKSNKCLYLSMHASVDKFPSVVGPHNVQQMWFS